MLAFTTLAFALSAPPPPSLDFQPVAAGMICSGGRMIASSAGRLAGGSNAGSVSGIAYSTSAPSATPLPSSTTIIVTSYATVTISSSASTSAPAQATTSTSAAASSTSSAASSASSATAVASSAGAAPTSTPTGGWPQQSSWASFDELFAANTPVMSESCSQFNQPNNSPQEIAEIKSAIQSVGQSTSVDTRFIFAVMMQESKGCSRVWQTNYGVQNPGLMQSHDGTGSCNTGVGLNGVPPTNSVAQNPCPSSQITQMIHDGVAGTSAGPGMQQLLKQASGNVFEAARLYNSGSLSPTGDLSAGGATSSYASDIANRLTLSLTGHLDSIHVHYSAGVQALG